MTIFTTTVGGQRAYRPPWTKANMDKYGLDFHGALGATVAYSPTRIRWVFSNFFTLMSTFQKYKCLLKPAEPFKLIAESFQPIRDNLQLKETLLEIVSLNIIFIKNTVKFNIIIWIKLSYLNG